jgi:MinD superfamily P-loop ATPase
VGEQTLTEGMLEIGSPFAVPIIKQLKNSIPSRDIIIYDSPPGTSCPVMETIHDADYVVVVTEPTPFGISDLKLMLETLKKMQLPAGVVLNRTEGDNPELREYLNERNISILMEIPYDRTLAEQYSRGGLFTEMNGEMKSSFDGLFERIQAEIGEEEAL